MGKFIVFEGIDGCGKTTQSLNLYKFLKKREYSVILTNEPGGTKLGKKIREILLSKSDEIFPPIAELLLYEADRNIHIHNVIKPFIEKDFIIISDRYKYSTLAYQSYGRGISLNLVKELNELASEKVEPDIVLFLDVSVTEAVKRLKAKGNADRLENESLEFFFKLRKGFLEIAEQNKHIFTIIDANQPEKDVFNDILKVLIERNIIDGR